MNKIDSNFFRYTLIMLVTAVVCIVIGGISLSRTIDDPENRFLANFNKSVFDKNLSSENSMLKQKLDEIKIVVDQSNIDSETKNKIYDILERK